MRRKLVVGNWKMHGNHLKNKALLTELIKVLKPFEQKSLNKADFALCVPFPYLEQAQTLLTDTNIAWGAQNVSQFEQGAFTASVSASMVADFGCTYAIIGHSERRALSNETNQSASNRFVRCVKADITPIFCVGETLQEHQAGMAFSVVNQQMMAITHTLDDQVFKHARKLNAVIAYEPVWAIGTSTSAKPEQAQEMHAFIRALIAKRDAGFAKKMRIIYGGSVTPDNASAIFNMPDVDGGLIGRSSLVADDFKRICAIACENQVPLPDK